jgi:general secretion pathway protein K
MNRSRGVALIIALVVVALATILATRIGTDGALNQRRATALMAQDQALAVAMGAEVWAMEVLRDSPASGQKASLDQPWATPLPTLPIDGGTVTGALEDMQGRFNLNNLLSTDGTKNEIAVAQFQRLLTAVGLETKWASLLLDWIDADSVVDGSDGAEDGVYLGQSPPYRTANRPITSTSELMALPGFGAERYRLIQPYVAALPVGTQLNTCTASSVVLDSLAAGMNAFEDAQQLAANRLAKGCFPDQNDVGAALKAAASNDADLQAATLKTTGQTSTWFRATIVVSIGTNELTLYSLMQRAQSGVSRVLLRTQGAE